MKKRTGMQIASCRGMDGLALLLKMPRFASPSLSKPADRVYVLPIKASTSFIIEADGDEKVKLKCIQHLYRDFDQEIEIASFAEREEAIAVLDRIEMALERGSRPHSRWPIVIGSIAAMFFMFLTGAVISTSSSPQAQSPPENQIDSQSTRGALSQTTDSIVAPPDAPRVDVSLLPISQAWGFGNPAGVPVYVFTDPECSYCQDLEASLVEIEATHFIHVFPTAFLGEKSAQIVAKLACAENPPAAWKNWMKNQTIDETITTETSAQENCVTAGLMSAWNNRAFMRAVGGEGTPFIIRADGETRTGYMSGEELRQWLLRKQEVF